MPPAGPRDALALGLAPRQVTDVPLASPGVAPRDARQSAVDVPGTASTRSSFRRFARRRIDSRWSTGR